MSPVPILSRPLAARAQNKPRAWDKIESLLAGYLISLSVTEDIVLIEIMK